MKKIKSAYSLIVMSPRKLIGARDPFGFKPLCIGKRDNAYFLSSEISTISMFGFSKSNTKSPSFWVCFGSKKARRTFFYMLGNKMPRSGGPQKPGPYKTGRAPTAAASALGSTSAKIEKLRGIPREPHRQTLGIDFITVMKSIVSTK
jgi:hypothetical protein